MLEYDYLLRRSIGENNVQEFKPHKIDNKLPNLVYIEGPNSSGKSTLLNIIALGLYGNKSKKINPNLINKIKSLINSDYQQIIFEFDITSLDKNTSLRSIKKNMDSDEIILQESINGKKFHTLSYESFVSKYNLIYDIPNNPTERLYDLLDEIKEEQLRYGNKISGFNHYLRELYTTITQYRDPERLKNLIGWIAEYETKKKEYELKKPEQEKFLNLLETYTYIKFYAFYLNEFIRITSRIEELQEEEKELKKAHKKSTSKGIKLRRDISYLQDQTRKYMTHITPIITSYLPKNQKKHLEIWKNLNVYRIIDYELDKSIIIEILHFFTLFSSELTEIESNESYQNAYVFDNIIKFLKDYQDTSILIPKLQINIKEFISLLEIENNENQLLIEKHELIKEILTYLTEMNKNISSINKQLTNLEKLKISDDELEEDIYDFIEDTSQIDSLKSALKDNKKKYELYLKRCLSKDIDLDNLQNNLSSLLKKYSDIDDLKAYFQLTESQLESRIISNKRELERINKEIVSYETLIERYTEEKTLIENQEPHKYENYKNEISTLIQIFSEMSQKLLSTYNSYIERLVNNEITNYKNKTEEEYFSKVFKYLAYKIGIFKHIDTSYKAKIVDLVQGVIITENDLTIHLSDMGTGQSQSAYLLGLLNVKDDKRKIIALFDEIAMMDETSLKPVYDRLRELYVSDRLLLGIVVQKGEEIYVESLEEKLNV